MIEDRLAAAGLPPLGRLSWLEVDVGALADNLRLLQRLAGGVPVSAVVKADAYGHGVEAAAQAFLDAGAERLCVATLDEALLLRGAGISAPLLVLFRVADDVMPLAAEHGIELTIADETSVDGLARLLPAGAALTVHIEVETGLGRAGIRPDRVAGVMATLADRDGVKVASIWTHLASAGDEAISRQQVAAFERAVAGLRDAGLPVPARHVAASGGILAASAPSYDGVRPGLCLYGLVPDGLTLSPTAAEAARGLRPALQLKARPLRIEEMAVGEAVSYGSHWRADRPSRICTLPVGYADGWPRLSWPGGEVLVHGRRVPLVGTVAMDAVMADVTDMPAADLDSEFTFLGVDGSESITADDVARARNTISWEVVSTLATRLPRVYHAGPVLVGTRTLTSHRRTTE